MYTKVTFAIVVYNLDQTQIHQQDGSSMWDNKCKNRTWNEV